MVSAVACDNSSNRQFDTHQSASEDEWSVKKNVYLRIVEILFHGVRTVRANLADLVGSEFLAGVFVDNLQ